MRFPIVSGRRRWLSGVLLGLAGLALAACDPAAPGGGASRTTTGAVRVALLVPAGAADPNIAFIGQSLTNAARMAVAGLEGAQIDLQVYDTAGSAAQAAQVATQAANEGAEVILGPLFAQSANAAGLAVAGRGLSVLSFSNNPAVAGGNVFILGPTFDNTANRLVGYARGQGLNRFMVVSGEGAAGDVGRSAIAGAVQRQGGQLVANATFPLSQQGIQAVAPGIAAQAEQTGAQVAFLTSPPNEALPFLVQFLPEAGLTRDSIQYMGLTRWDVPASAIALPGLQGGVFALPDPAAASRFAGRYAAAFGASPHATASLAFDGIAAIGALAAAGQAPTAGNLTRAGGFSGGTGVFRLLTNGSNERALAVARINDNRVTIVSAAPGRLGGAGF